MSIGERLRNRRKEQKLTLRALAQKSKVSISFLSDIEHERRNPSLDKLGMIAQGLETTVSFLLGEETDHPEKQAEYRNYQPGGDKSLEFREVLQKIEGFDDWSHEDREELLTYLKVKEKVRHSKQKN